MVTDTATHPALTTTWDDYLCAAGRESERARDRDPDDFPWFTEGGSWRVLPAGATSRWDGDVYEHGNWTAGFWFGVSWLRALGADDRAAAALAHERLAALTPRGDDPTTHDLGFLFHPGLAFAESAGLIDPEQTGPAHAAARMTARRFNAAGGYIQAFGPIGDVRSAGTSTIDTMMNLPLLWWASARGGDPLLFDVARRHARTSARLFLREDGSTYQLNRYDPGSGALLHRGTYQGASESSCWSRGQAWAVCGFAWAYAATGEAELLTAAERAAGYFWRMLPDDGVPPWDFSDRSAGATRDASASAVAALGAVILGHVHSDQAQRQGFAWRGADLLARLGGSCLNRDPATAGILLHSCYSKPHGWGVDGAMGWGDFYYGLGLALATGTVTLGAALGFAVTQVRR